ncbi:MAG: protein kinase, partial [Mogibacterium sp.]|nr:protein kinase [Mogibacterium sp.]
MANVTEINEALRQDPTAETEINTILEEYNRQNGIEPEPAPALREGTDLCDGYIVRRQLEVRSGEADLYLCVREGAEYVAKVYHRPLAIKQEVEDKLMAVDSPYVARLSAAGMRDGCPVEILPYYPDGSLQGHTFSLETLRERIIPEINEGLRAIHEAGILHKDLKPANIMRCADGESVAIIDFGISSAVEENITFLITQTGMTPEYSAPETFRGIIYEGSDYYSFG